MKKFLMILALLLFIPCLQLSADEPVVYESTFGFFCSGGDFSDMGEYSMIDTVKSKGIGSELQVSSDYSVLPILAIEEETHAGVSTWMLY